jgi:hypothetical protein
MVPFEMSIDARMMLAKMSLVYERERGARVRMSRDEDIITLINYAVDSINEEIGKQFELFRRLLTPLEVKALAAQGANIYRGAVVSSENETEAPGDMIPGKRMYRGNLMGSSTPTSPMQSEPKTPSGKSKRVYRGRVIED